MLRVIPILSDRFVNPFGFTGYQKENVGGMLYAQARYYMPQQGRFNAEDTVRDGLNWYEYARSNPLRFVDKNGLWATSYMQSPSEPIRDVTPELNAALRLTVLEAMERRNLYQEAFESSFIRIRSIPIRVNPFCALSSTRQAVDNLAWFYQQVNHNAPWDIKLEERWEDTIVGTDFPGTDIYVNFRGNLMTPEQLGNFTFGYIGRSMGLSRDILLIGSMYAAMNSNQFRTHYQRLNELEDWNFILKGYNSFEVSSYECE